MPFEENGLWVYHLVPRARSGGDSLTGPLQRRPPATRREIAADTVSIREAIHAPSPAVYPDTELPLVFNFDAGGQPLHVVPNVTEHMAEFIRGTGAREQPGSSTGTADIRAERMVEILTSFREAVSTTLERGITLREMITVGPWELGFSQPSDPNLLPVIYHGVYRGRRSR